MAASFAPLDLPDLEEQIPALLVSIQTCISQLARTERSALRAFEPLYEKLHGLKGLTKMLPCDPALAKALVEFCETISKFCHDKIALSDRASAQLLLQELKKSFSEGKFEPVEAKLKILLSTNQPLTAQELKLPFVMPYSEPSVERRWLEAQLLKYKIFSIEEQLELSKLLPWKETLLQSLTKESDDLGFLIHTIPYVFAENSRNVRLWVCFASPKDISSQLCKALPQARLSPL